MWKQLVNTTLARLTGYQLQRAGGPHDDRDPQPSARTMREAGERSRDHVRATPMKSENMQRMHAKSTGDQVQPVRPGRGLPPHYDDDAKRIIRWARPRTMTGHEKMYGLVMAARYVVQHQIPGDIVECGVWRGGSMQIAARALLEAGSRDRDLHLFDTFEGMPPPSEKDRRGNRTAAELLEASDRDSKIWAVATEEDVRAAMDETGYPARRIHFHPGMVEDTIPQEAPEQIAILRLDTDWYDSTRHELEHLYDRLSPGGVLIIDDYGGWEGSRLATHEFLEKTNAPLLLLPLAGGRIAVKPGRL